MGAGVMVAKAILGGIGGAFNGAKDGHAAIAKKVGTSDTDNSKEMYDTTYSIGNMGMDKLKEQRDGLVSQFMSGKGNAEGAKAGKDAAGSAGSSAGSSAAGSAGSSAASGAAASSAASGAAAAASDIDLKSIYGDSIDDKIIENFAKIAAIDFKYKADAQSEYNGEFGVDGQEHIGIKAQDLQDNEATKGTVSENENGDLVVDTRHLTFADTAAIAELSRRVLALEEIVKELQNK